MWDSGSENAGYRCVHLAGSGSFDQDPARNVPRMTRMEQKVSFESSGIILRGTLHRTGMDSASNPAIVLCHGFGGNSDGAGHPELARTLQRAGYVVLRFDFRGCGSSDGTPGRIICMEEVDDLRNAITFLISQDGVDAGRIGVIGASLGGSVALHAAAIDLRIRACAANGAIGNGERRFRYQYPDDEKWLRFRKRLEEAKLHQRRTGLPIFIHRYDIVEIPERWRAGMPAGAIMDFSAETAISMLEFEPEAVVAQIAPRPLLLVHPLGDAVVPKSESENIAAAAGDPCELHLIETANHFASADPGLQKITVDWLRRHLPPIVPGDAGGEVRSAQRRSEGGET
jgi:pimeloyl-ACP methyl ester carboxylesterase